MILKKLMQYYKIIKRIIHRCAEEVDATRRIAKVTSLKEGLETFRAKVDIQIMNRNGYYENEARKNHLLRKHDIMLRYYEKTFGDFLETYDYRVIILTDDNYKQYVDIPEWVEEKKKKGVISRTHYSDILRLSLLARHGGMWIDSTFYCTDNVLDEYFKWPLWSIKRPDYFHQDILPIIHLLVIKRIDGFLKLS